MTKLSKPHVESMRKSDEQQEKLRRSWEEIFAFTLTSSARQAVFPERAVTFYIERVLGTADTSYIADR